MTQPTLQQVNLVTHDLNATIEFCRLLGWDVSHPGFPHLDVVFDSGVSVEFDEVESVASWNSGSPGPGSAGAVITLGVADRGAVDAIWERVTSAGHRSAQRPFDAFWGSRFAVVVDPDGNQFGLMSPRDEALKSWPPAPAPG